MKLSKSIHLVLAAVLAGAAGGLSGYLALGSTPQPEFRLQAFKVTADHVVRPDRPLEILNSFADFDLHATVELPPMGELDLVFRKVQPWGPDDQVLPNFASRFHLLRLSSKQAGPPYRSREQALFGDRQGGLQQGGLLLTAGQPASLKLMGRGRRVHAWVAGSDLPAVYTVDDYGSFHFHVRGGNALVKDLRILPQPGQQLAMLALAIPAALGAVLGMVLVWRRRPWSYFLVFVLLLPLGALLARLTVLQDVLPASVPSLPGVLCASVCGLGLAMASTWRSQLLGLLFCLGMLFATAQLEGFHLRSKVDPRLQQHFGVDSGDNAYMAFSGRLRNRSFVHVVQADAKDDFTVMFLGSGLLFDAADQRGLSLTDRVQGNLLQQLGGRSCRCLALPTLGSTPQQQLLLYERFYRSFAPKVMVFAVTEGAADAVALRQTLQGILQRCEADGTSLILLAGEVLESEQAKALESFIDEHELPRVDAANPDTGELSSEKLVEALVQVLLPG